ncbi:MAG: 2OG-Fe(II) oxygenase [Panacagrimonas sp.]
MSAIPAPGTAAPWFKARTSANPSFTFDTVGGRYVVLCFFGSAAREDSAAVLRGIEQNSAVFDDRNACFFGVSTDPDDEARNRVADAIPGRRFFWDFDRAVSRLYGAIDANHEHQTYSLILDPNLRVLAVLPFGQQADRHVEQLVGALSRLPKVPDPYRAPPQAPVLVVPHVFEPRLCEQLIAYYDETGGEDSGFMRDVDGKTTRIIEHGHKRRRDRLIDAEDVRKACLARIRARLIPQIEKAYQFKATRMERYLVACYSAEESGHFRPHRDNTTKGTAHRRFAVSLFLNSGQYEGGFLRFPEYGPGLYSAPLGGAVVFSCSMLHEAMAVTKGKRYMFLPFLYDEQGRRIRDENLKYLADVSA